MRKDKSFQRKSRILLNLAPEMAEKKKKLLNRHVFSDEELEVPVSSATMQSSDTWFAQFENFFPFLNCQRKFISLLDFFSLYNGSCEQTQEIFRNSVHYPFWSACFRIGKTRGHKKAGTCKLPQFIFLLCRLAPSIGTMRLGWSHFWFKINRS